MFIAQGDKGMWFMQLMGHCVKDLGIKEIKDFGIIGNLRVN